MTNCKLVALLFACPLFSAIVFDFNVYIYDHYPESLILIAIMVSCGLLPLVSILLLSPLSASVSVYV
jgi:hypothetical protein